MTTMKNLFPYGTFPVDPLLRECYARDYSRAVSYPLADRLPSHHPLLRSLEGSFSLAYTLPPWWPSCVAQVKLTQIKPLLATLSAEEFRAGCIEQARWKAFRETLSEEERRQLPTSPKLGILLADTNWSTHFGDRGPATTPDQLVLHVSTQPLDFLYMSNGQSWRSCQRCQDGCENYRLPGNFYDTSVAIATVRAPNTSAQDPDSLLARTTVRLFLRQGQPVLALGRTYHNNETVALLLLRALADLFDARCLAWGFMVDVNTFAYYQDGSLGDDLAHRVDQLAGVASESSWFPRNWYVPYIDGGEHDWSCDYAWEDDDYSPSRLRATLCLMHPRIAHCPPATRVPEQLAGAGMVPHIP